MNNALPVRAGHLFRIWREFMKKKNRLLLIVLLIAALLLAVMIVAARASHGGAPQPTAEPTPMSTPVPAAETPEPKAEFDTIWLGSGLKVTKAESYTGIFVEDGSDEAVSGVFSVFITNEGSSDVQYAHVVLSRGEEKYDFDFTTLPAGATVRVLEQSRQAMPEELTGFKGELTTYAEFDGGMSMCEDAVSVDAEDGVIYITNNTDAEISQLYVYYKSVQGDSYMGGITYRTGISSIAPGTTVSGTALHFRGGESRVMFVTYVP